MQDESAAGAWDLLHACQQRPGDWPAQPVNTERLAGLLEAIVNLCTGRNADGRLEVVLLTSQRVLRVAQLMPNAWTAER